MLEQNNTFHSQRILDYVPLEYSFSFLTHLWRYLYLNVWMKYQDTYDQTNTTEKEF